VTIQLTPSTFVEKIALSLIIAAIVIGVALFIGTKIVNAQVAAMKAELTTVKSEFVKQTGAIDAKVTILMTQVSEKDKQIANLTADKAKLEAKEAKDQIDLANATAKLKDAPPETLVSEGRRILQTKEINYLKATNLVEFSLAAYRTDVIRLVEWEAFTLKILPDKDNRITNLTTTNETLVSENKDLKDVHVLDTQWKVVANTTMDHYYNLSMKAIAPGFWKQFFGDIKSNAFWTGVGFAIGYVTHKK
jgi:hypothetical protein